MSGAGDFKKDTVRTFLRPIINLLDDEKVTEIMVNRYDQIYVERKGKLSLSEITFSGEKARRVQDNLYELTIDQMPGFYQLGFDLPCVVVFVIVVCRR